jgi:dolichol-phosphate mannosyltransferase
MAGVTGKNVTIVLPTFNEHECLPELLTRLDAMAGQRTDLAFEFLFVDDGSRDGSLDILLEARESDPRISVISLARNSGHQIAITAGLDASVESDAAIVMDADLQDPPKVCLDLIERWEAGADVVYAQRRSRRDPLLKRLTAYLYYWFLAKAAHLELPRDSGDFRLMDRRVLVELSRYRERSRYLRGLVAHVGFRQEGVQFDRDPRFAGSTGYSWRQMTKLATDGLFGFSTAPLSLVSRVGVAVSGISLLLITYVLFIRLFRPAESVPGWAFLGVGMFFLGGLQILMLGVLASYLGRVYVEAQARPLYSVALVARDARCFD